MSEPTRDPSSCPGPAACRDKQELIASALSAIGDDLDAIADEIESVRSDDRLGPADVAELVAGHAENVKEIILAAIAPIAANANPDEADEILAAGVGSYVDAVAALYEIVEGDDDDDDEDEDDELDPEFSNPGDDPASGEDDPYARYEAVDGERVPVEVAVRIPLDGEPVTVPVEIEPDVAAEIAKIAEIDETA